MSIQKYLDKIKDAVFGKDIREAIYNSIKQCYDDAAINNDNANMEVKFARGSHPTLNDRLTDINEQLDTIANKGTTVEVLERVTKEEIDRQIKDGTITTLTVKDKSISLNKLEEDTGKLINNIIIKDIQVLTGTATYNNVTGEINAIASSNLSRILIDFDKKKKTVAYIHIEGYSKEQQANPISVSAFANGADQSGLGNIYKDGVYPLDLSKFTGERRLMLSSTFNYKIKIYITLESSNSKLSLKEEFKHDRSVKNDNMLLNNIRDIKPFNGCSVKYDSVTGELFSGRNDTLVENYAEIELRSNENIQHLIVDGFSSLPSKYPFSIYLWNSDSDNKRVLRISKDGLYNFDITGYGTTYNKIMIRSKEHLVIDCFVICTTNENSASFKVVNKIQELDNNYKKLNEYVLRKTNSYVMACFKSNTERFLTMLTSEDGKKFEVIKENCYNPYSTYGNETLRDPSIVRYKGDYIIAYSKNDTSEGRDFGLIKSSNLVDWEFICNVNVPRTYKYVWAPELFIDDDGSLHCFVTLDMNDKTAFKIYELHPTSDLKTWSTPVEVTGDFSTHSVIDAFMFKDNNKYYLWYKDTNTGQIQYAISDNLTTGFITHSFDKNWGGWGSTGSQEDCCLIKKQDGGYRLFFDDYSALKFYYTDSKDMVNWSYKTEIVSETTVRHGTVLYGF